RDHRDLHSFPTRRSSDLSVGGCQLTLAPGSEVLWGYNFFGLAHLLRLSGSSNANVGTPIDVHVADGQTGQPIAGALIGEDVGGVDRKSTRLNSSHLVISY